MRFITLYLLLACRVLPVISLVLGLITVFVPFVSMPILVMSVIVFVLCIPLIGCSTSHIMAEYALQRSLRDMEVTDAHVRNLNWLDIDIESSINFKMQDKNGKSCFIKSYVSNEDPVEAKSLLNSRYWIMSYYTEDGKGEDLVTANTYVPWFCILVRNRLYSKHCDKIQQILDLKSL